jgi:hypothetical protein
MRYRESKSIVGGQGRRSVATETRRAGIPRVASRGLKPAAVSDEDLTQAELQAALELERIEEEAAHARLSIEARLRGDLRIARLFHGTRGA